jgi:hypothetical protein
MEGDREARQGAAGVEARTKPSASTPQASLGSHQNPSSWAQHLAHKADVRHPLANQKIGLN